MRNLSVEQTVRSANPIRYKSGGKQGPRPIINRGKPSGGAASALIRLAFSFEKVFLKTSSFYAG